jgi:polyhydroxybutyrate depolymerase
VALLALGLAGCTVTTAPGPVVQPQAEGRGKVPGQASAPSTGCTYVGPDAPPVGRSVQTITWKGQTRTAIVQVPDVDGLGPRPLLVSLHPFALNAEVWEQYSGLSAAAKGRGYITVSPYGSDPGPRWAVPGGVETGIDDIGFVGALLDRLEDRLCVDRNREFAAGFSAGAAMAQALSCTMPWRFAAVAGSSGVNLTSPCPASPATDVFVLHGTVDQIAPLTGSTTAFATPLGLAVDTVVATDAARAGCDPTPVLSTPVPQVEARTFTGCADGQRVQYWKEIGAGHTWAGPTTLLDLVAGPTLTTFSANTVVLDFFDAE